MTSSERITETIAILELGQQFSIEGSHDGFVKASKAATKSFTLCGVYIKAAGNAGKARQDLEVQVGKVKKLKEEYEGALRLQRKMMDELDILVVKADAMKLKVSESFKEASEIWEEGKW